MQFVLQPSLENIVLVQVTTTLFNQHDVKDLVKNYSYSQSVSDMDSILYPHERLEEWKKIEGRVMDKVPELTISTSLKEKLLGYIHAIGTEILKWMEYHFKFCSFDLRLPNNLYWTPHGTIDKKKTAEVLIKDETIDITIRYILACVYCLEDAIPKLWHELPESDKFSLHNKIKMGYYFQRELLSFWEQYVIEKDGIRDNMTERLNPITFSDSYMLQCAALSGSKAATGYFLKNLIEKKQSLDEVLLNTAICVAQRHYQSAFNDKVRPGEYCSEVFCFLLSQMNDEQQLQLFKKCPIETLYCLSDWPWQSFFVETTSRLFNFPPFQILKILICKVNTGFKVYNYQKVFQDVWQLMRHAQKSQIIKDREYFSAFHLLLQIEDYENIKFIFQNITLTERKKFIFSSKGLFFCEYLVCRGQWDLFKNCILLCASSKNEIVKFKKKFQELIQRKMATGLLSENVFDRNKNKLEELFQHLDELVCGHDKRKPLNDDECNPAKRLGNIEYKE